MGGNYVYFCASLPTLRFGGTPPLSAAAFAELAAANLPAADCTYLACCTLPPNRETAVPAASVYARFRSWDFALRGEIARLRSTARGDAATPALPPETDTVGGGLKEAVAAAAGAPNPLERERRIDLLRWRQLDELELGREYTLEAVACYRLKLAILEREAAWSEAAGRSNFEDAVNRIDRNSLA